MLNFTSTFGNSAGSCWHWQSLLPSAGAARWGVRKPVAPLHPFDSLEQPGQVSVAEMSLVFIFAWRAALQQGRGSQLAFLGCAKLQHIPGSLLSPLSPLCPPALQGSLLSWSEAALPWCSPKKSQKSSGICQAGSLPVFCLLAACLLPMTVMLQSMLRVPLGLEFPM